MDLVDGTAGEEAEHIEDRAGSTVACCRDCASAEVHEHCIDSDGNTAHGRQEGDAGVRQARSTDSRHAAAARPLA